MTTPVQFPVWLYQLVGYLELNQVNYVSKHAGYHLLSALTENWKTVLPGSSTSVSIFQMSWDLVRSLNLDGPVLGAFFAVIVNRPPRDLGPKSERLYKLARNRTHRFRSISTGVEGIAAVNSEQPRALDPSCVEQSGVANLGGWKRDESYSTVRGEVSRGQ